MNCKICGRQDIKPSFGGADVCSFCDCGGMFVQCGNKYIRTDFLSSYGYVSSQEITQLKKENEELKKRADSLQKAHNYNVDKVGDLEQALSEAREKLGRITPDIFRMFMETDENLKWIANYYKVEERYIKPAIEKLAQKLHTYIESGE